MEVLYNLMTKLKSNPCKAAVHGSFKKFNGSSICTVGTMTK